MGKTGDGDCGCGGKGDPPASQLMDEFRQTIQRERREMLVGPMAEMVALMRTPTPTIDHPSDVLGIASHRVVTGSVFTVPRSPDRMRVHFHAYATQDGAGVLEAFVGLPGATLAPDDVSGLGVPLLFTEADGRPVSTFTMPTRAALEVRVTRVVGQGLVVVVQELSEPT